MLADDGTPRRDVRKGPMVERLEKKQRKEAHNAPPSPDTQSRMRAERRERRSNGYTPAHTTAAASPDSRRNYVLMYEDPETGEVLSFDSPRYAAKLQELIRINNWEGLWPDLGMEAKFEWPST